MLNGIEELTIESPTDEQILKEIEDAGIKARVHPLDPDFLAFALPLAIIFDLLDIIFELTSVFVLPKAVGVALDVFTGLIIGGWIYYRTGKIIKSREEQKKALQRAITKRGAALQQQLTKGVIKSPVRRALTRAGIAFLGEIIPLVGLIPFWTISVISTLREK